MNSKVNMTSGYSVSLPVFSAEMTGKQEFKLSGEIRGTCFSIGENYMLTAGHVASGLSCVPGSCAVVGLSNPDSRYFKGALVDDIEALSCDIGLLRVKFIVPESADWFYSLKWAEHDLNPFDNVRCLGFAYGMHTVEDSKSCVQRAFQGHIVSNLLQFKPLRYKGKPFAVYELSFGAPRGLSGSPLLNSHGTLTLNGLIIGNSESRMLVFQSEEREASEKSETIVEQYESLSLGIAVRADQIFKLNSRILGTTIGEYLRSRKLVI